MNVKHKYISIFITCFVGLFLLVSCSDEDIAAIKLVAHLKKYDQAKDVMITRNYLSQNPIARDEWEILFMMEEADKFTQNEIDYLSSNRKLIIAENAARAARQSAIDLNPLRKDQAALGDFCHQIPKGGMLHVHPYGILSRSVIVEILERFNPT
ncbi:MAG: hypothetical protein O2963_02110, partial [Proteobacteria bacterium]|nr:hypothetical protein [Pseudomonadota bacterium]